MTVRHSFVSAYPPTRCGSAGFTAALRAAFPESETDDRAVVRVVDSPRTDSPPEVVADLVAGDVHSVRAAAHEINRRDVVIVQYEPGAYGGADGEDVLVLLDAVRVPRIVVLHTVPAAPTWRQRWVLQAVLDRAEAVVVMTVLARTRITARFDVSAAKLHVIPHGAGRVGTAAQRRRAGRPTVLTWGLLGPGKGVEWAIWAMRELVELDPAPRYVIAGRTHPRVLARDGESYREKLTAQVRQLGLDGSVCFDDRYFEPASLQRLIASADAVVLPYDSPDQISSGVLSEAVAAALPVVATPFPQAIELLADGAGRLVPRRDSAAIAAALRVVLTRHDTAARMRTLAAQAAEELYWPMVAQRYRRVAAELLLPSVTS